MTIVRDMSDMPEMAQMDAVWKGSISASDWGDGTCSNDLTSPVPQLDRGVLYNVRTFSFGLLTRSISDLLDRSIDRLELLVLSVAQVCKGAGVW